MRKFATVILTGLIVIGVAACGGGGSSKTIKTPNGNVTVDSNGGKIKINGKGGSVSIGGGGIPDGFPKSDVPLPDISTKDIVTSSSSTVNGKQIWSLTYKAGGTSAAKDYINKLKDAGYTEGNSTSSGGYSSAELSKGKYTVNVIGTSGSAGGTSGNTLTVAVRPSEASDTTTSDTSTSDTSNSGL
jgi:hypothetical protein